MVRRMLLSRRTKLELVQVTHLVWIKCNQAADIIEFKIKSLQTIRRHTLFEDISPSGQMNLLAGQNFTHLFVSCSLFGEMKKEIHTNNFVNSIRILKSYK